MLTTFKDVSIDDASGCLAGPFSCLLAPPRTLELATRLRGFGLEGPLMKDFL